MSEGTPQAGGAHELVTDDSASRRFETVYLVMDSFGASVSISRSDTELALELLTRLRLQPSCLRPLPGHKAPGLSRAREAASRLSPTFDLWTTPPVRRILGRGRGGDTP